MASLGGIIPAGSYLTLLDWSRRVAPDGSIDEIAEYLSQCNEIFDDMIWTEGNLPTGHKTTIRTGLPQGTWRMINQGVPATKSTTAQVTEGIGSLQDYSIVDKELADLNGNVAAFRYSEDNAHLEGLSQQVASTLFYGNPASLPQAFLGFSPRFNTILQSNAQNALNVLNAGGVGSSNASIWLMGWGERTCFGFYPKGSEVGLQFKDLGDTRAAFDASGNPFEAYWSHFMWKLGLCVKDWRYVVRIGNIDTTTAGLAGLNPPDLFALMAKAVLRLPKADRRVSGITKSDAPDDQAVGVRLAWYTNRTVREYMDIQAIRDKNVLISMEEFAGQAVQSFRGIPIRINDVLLNTEAALT